MKEALFTIIDDVSLEELGYDKGSIATIDINSTREWELAWSRCFDIQQNKGESYTDWQERCLAAQLPLAAMKIKRVVLKANGKEVGKWEEVDAETLREIDNLEPRLMDVVMRERNERNAQRALNATLSFRQRRSDAITTRKEGKPTGGVGSDKPADDSKGD